jgi:hypothetical protein
LAGEYSIRELDFFEAISAQRRQPNVIESPSGPAFAQFQRFTHKKTAGYDNSGD